MSQTKPPRLPLRIALREEGSCWNAYLAPPDTMVGAKFIGSIARGSIERHPEIKQAFMKVMKMVVEAAIHDTHGLTVDHWEIPQAAPKHERSRNA